MDRKKKMIGIVALGALGAVALAAASSGTASAATKGSSASGKQFPPELQKLMADAIANGGAPALTSAAYQLEKAGWPAQAEELRKRARDAIDKAPPPTKTEITAIKKMDPAISEGDAQKAAQILKQVSDPDALKKAADALRAAGMKNTADQLDAKGASVAVTTLASDALKQIDKTIQTSPGIVPGGTVNMPAELIAVPRTDKEIAALNAVRQINALVQKYGGNLKAAKASKGATDVAFAVKKFQGMAGLTADGKSGPGTTLAYARNGVGVLPPVLYWPPSATAKTVLAFREQVNAIANASTDPLVAAALRQSAARERGQGGIVGQMPA